MSLHRLSSSLRASSLSETLAKARCLAHRYGIVRVTDTTRLDWIGIPVFASIRPNAEPNSLCVHAGKGVNAEEARVGAYMEAIEFAAVEFRRRNINVYESTPRRVAEQPALRGQFVDFCPILGRDVDPDDPLICVDAEDIVTHERVSVPAELVFFPYNENNGQRIFGTSTNGLCSGNTVDEATLHGLCEVLERDIQAFNFVRDASKFVNPSPTDDVAAQLMRRVENAGLQPALRFTPTDHGIPYFQAFILEPTDSAPIAISHGTGCHPVRDIAAVRALTEAAQSRLSYIHGGRDDLIERARFFASQSPEIEARETSRMRSRVLSQDPYIDYAETSDLLISEQYSENDILTTLNQVTDLLNQSGFPQVLRVLLTPPSELLSVVRVIVPGLESFEPSLKRAGPRLRDHVSKWR